jgi:ring-1,2-phenylacetyl-CoA epoxidase subunit PaaC
MNPEAIKDLVIKMADDELILGHRNSEWTGLGPVMEEDIAFSSMAQDKIGHAWALYQVLHEQLNGTDPDRFAFLRKENEYRCSQFVEMPNGSYDFSLMRHFLFDHAETVRYESLAGSAFEPLKTLALKIRGELKYHTLHANAWVLQLSQAGEESRARMQQALNETIGLALGIFEPSDNWEDELISGLIYPGEEVLRQRWEERVIPVLTQAGLSLPDLEKVEPIYGGRKGYHTVHLLPLLNEMSEVYKLDTEASW